LALNKVIVKKINEETEGVPEIREFLVKLLQFESESPGWWKAKYNSILNNTCKEGGSSNARNKY